MKARYSQEFNNEVVEEFGRCRDVRQVVARYGVSRSTVYDWARRLGVVLKGDDARVSYNDYLNVRKQLEQVSRELEIVYRTRCFKDSPRRQKLEAVEKLFGQYSIVAMCQILDLPRGTFYNHHFRRVPETIYEKNKTSHKEVITRIFEESGQRFGITKIFNKMKAEGYSIDFKTVSALYKELGLKSKQAKKRTFKQKACLKFNSIGNKLNRQFNPSEPNKFWVSDTTYIRVGTSFFYLCVVVELFSRKIIAHRLSSQDNASLIINTFKDAYENRNTPTELTFHSDKGSGYTSNNFRSLLHSLRVVQSCSKSGNPYDNAVVESFFSHLKREELNSHDFEYIDELQKCVDEYIEYYNNYRPHDSLNNKTPSQIEQEYAAT